MKMNLQFRMKTGETPDSLHIEAGLACKECSQGLGGPLSLCQILHGKESTHELLKLVAELKKKLKISEENVAELKKKLKISEEKVATFKSVVKNQQKQSKHIKAVLTGLQEALGKDPQAGSAKDTAEASPTPDTDAEERSSPYVVGRKDAADPAESSAEVRAVPAVQTVESSTGGEAKKRNKRPRETSIPSESLEGDVQGTKRRKDADAPTESSAEVRAVPAQTVESSSRPPTSGKARKYPVVNSSPVAATRTNSSGRPSPLTLASQSGRKRGEPNNKVPHKLQALVDATSCSFTSEEAFDLYTKAVYAQFATDGEDPISPSANSDKNYTTSQVTDLARFAVQQALKEAVIKAKLSDTFSNLFDNYKDIIGNQDKPKVLLNNPSGRGAKPHIATIFLSGGEELSPEFERMCSCFKKWWNYPSGLSPVSSEFLIPFNRDDPSCKVFNITKFLALIHNIDTDIKMAFQFVIPQHVMKNLREEANARNPSKLDFTRSEDVDLPCNQDGSYNVQKPTNHVVKRLKAFRNTFHHSLRTKSYGGVLCQLKLHFDQKENFPTLSQLLVLYVLAKHYGVILTGLNDFDWCHQISEDLRNLVLSPHSSLGTQFDELKKLFKNSLDRFSSYTERIFADEDDNTDSSTEY